MWPFHKRISLQASGLFHGFTDWHSHILPGVDDGVRTTDEALRVLAGYERLGIREVWLTPHIMEDIPNTTGQLRGHFARLQAVYKGSVILHLASENMLDNLFEERLQKNDLLPLGKEGKHLLVETSYFNPPMGLGNILLRIKNKGYHPVLAHPERYLYMDRKDYSALKAQGVSFQLNLPSLAGAYGAGVSKKAGWLLKNGFYDFAGSDIHRAEAWEKLTPKKQIPENAVRMLHGIPTVHSPE